jgi:HAD superfamily hydrolase (TIGR01509 family)
VNAYGESTLIKAVIFDLDGLLVDSEPVWFRARTEMLTLLGLIWTDEDQKNLMGVSTATWVRYLTDKLQGRMSSEEIKEESLRKMASFYRSGDVPMMPGAQQAIEACNGRYKLGLASGSPRLLIDAALNGSKWRSYFSHVLSSDEVKRGKPAPDVYVEVMRRMGVAAQETAVIEDSGNGILAGKAAGAKVIAVPNPQLMPAPEALSKADVVIESLVELGQMLENMK